MEGCSYVLHCGALVSDWATAEEIAAANVAGTRNLLEPAPTHRCAASSTSAPPTSTAIPAAQAIDEAYAATRFRNWYAQTKRDAEAEVRRVMDAGALDAVILRPATVYGPGSTGRRSARSHARSARATCC